MFTTAANFHLCVATHGVVPALCLSDMHLLYSPPVYVCTVLLCQDTIKWHEFCGTFPDVVPLLCVAVVINSHGLLYCFCSKSQCVNDGGPYCGGTS